MLIVHGSSPAGCAMKKTPLCETSFCSFVFLIYSKKPPHTAQASRKVGRLLFALNAAG